MSANLDKSLDDLVGSRRQTARHTARRRGGSRRAATKPSTVGGVKKSTKAAPKSAHPAPIAQTGSSKILVSGLVSSCSYDISTCPCANILSLPMCPRPMSRYVDLKALILASIAISFLEKLAAQTISTDLPTSLYLLPHRWIFLDARRTHSLLLLHVSAKYTHCWRSARLEVKLCCSTVKRCTLLVLISTWESTRLVL